MREALVTNNEAVQVALVGGSYDRAIQLLEKAQERLSELAKQPAMTVPDEAPRQNTWISAIRVHDETSDGVGMMDSPGSVFSAFPHAFTMQCKGPIDKTSVFELSVLLIYNKAFSFHLRGVSKPSGGHRDLMTALRLYSFGLSIVRKQVNSFDILSNFHLVVLALLNNALHLFSHFHNLGQVRRRKANMQDLLEVFEKAGICERNCETDVFYANVFFGACCDLKVAAAA